MADYEVVKRERKAEHQPRYYSGKHHRKFYSEKRARRRTAEVKRGVAYRAVHLLETGQY